MAATRLFRMSRPLGHPHQPCNNFFSSSCNFHSVTPWSYSKPKCFSKGDLGAESTFPADHGDGTGENLIRKAAGEVKASSAITSDCAVTSSETTKTAQGLDLGVLLATVRNALVRRLNEVRRGRPWKLYVQTVIEKGIMDCRFVTLFAVAGSLLGSLLCYIEGCFLILESYIQYFHALSRGSELGHLVHLLIEAIDVYLVATAMLVFGVGLHVLFVGSYDLDDIDKKSSKSNYPKTLPSHVGMSSIMQAKTKIGHAVVMILQVGVLEKFKSVPLVTGLDLACFAGAVFLSATCIFLLSKLSIITTADG